MKQLDLLKELEVLEKHKKAKEEHRKFVDFMHPHFGLNERPKYCEIRMRPLWAMGLYGDGKIYVSNSHRYGLRSNAFTTWHESSHFLHFHRNQLYSAELKRKIKREESYSDDEFTVNETVANLGAFIYLEKKFGLSQQNIIKYAFADHDETNIDEMLSLVIALRDKSLLAKIAALTANEAMKLIQPYKEEADLYLNSLCKKQIPSKDFEKDSDFSFRGKSYFPQVSPADRLDISQVEFDF